MIYDLADFKRLGSSYLPEKGTHLETIPHDNDGLYMPLVVDTEFVSRPNQPRKRLTIQCKYFFQPHTTALIFDDWDSCVPELLRRHITPSQPDLLREMIVRTLGDSVTFKAVLEPDEDGGFRAFADLPYDKSQYSGVIDKDNYLELPAFVVGVYVHFGVAELMAMGRRGSHFNRLLAKSCRDEIELKHFNNIEFKRRLTASTISKNERHISSWLDCCVCVDIAGKGYRLSLAFIDTASWGSYKNLLSAANVPNPDKNLISRHAGGDIERMDKIYIERPQDYDDYARGDLLIDDALININALHMADLQDNGLPQTLRKLTDGSHVADRIRKIIENKYPALSKEIDFNADKKIPFNGKKRFLLGNSAYMARIQDNEVAKLARVAGGRCRNNKQTVIQVDAPVCDIDISGCYGDGMRAQLFPLGRPETSSKPVRLDKFVEDIMPLFPYGGFVGLVSGALDFEQDLIQSWVNTDKLMLEVEEEVFEVDRGTTRIYSREIVNGIITHDVIEAINAHGQKIAKRFLSQLTVISWMGYKTENRFETEKDLMKAFRLHFDDKEELSNAEMRQPDSTDFYGWIGETIGDFMIDGFITTRKKAQKIHGKGSPQDAAAKLNVNTSFGVLASQYFPIGNVLAANCVTARARVLCWMMEKSFDSFHSITDGGGFQLNKVYTPKNGRAFAIQQAVNTFGGKCDNLNRTSLGGENIAVFYRDGVMCLRVGGVELDNRQALEFLNRTAWEHISALFPDHPIVTTGSTSLTVDGDTLERVYIERRGLYEFEVKDCYTGAILHGSSNYQYKRGDEWAKIKFRSYESNRPYIDITGGGAFDELNPVQVFFRDLAKNPRKVPILPPFKKAGIIKVSDYRQSYRRYHAHGLTVGDSKWVYGAFRPFSTSQFTFISQSQWEQVDKIVTRDKLRLGWSFERYFLNKDGTLNYKAMIDTVEKMIRAGDTDITPYLEKTAREIRELKKLKYPWFELLEQSKEWVENFDRFEQFEDCIN